MKKILFVCDGEHFPEGAFKFVTSLQVAETVSLKALFFTELAVETLAYVTDIPFAAGPFAVIQKGLKEEINGSREKFIEKCKSVGIRHKMDETDRGWDKELFVKETRFADLAVISEQLFYKELSGSQPNFFMQEALHYAECPVLIIPESFSAVERIILAYDGTKESVFALKQFTHMFQQFEDLPIEFVHIKNSDHAEIPDKELLKEYSNAHFDAGNIRELNIMKHHSFSNWLAGFSKTLLITGSFSRSAVSMLIKPSFVKPIIEKNSVPIFIAHNA
jgi:hypothetical protein